MSFQADHPSAKSPSRGVIDPGGPNFDQSLVVELQRRLKKASMIQEELGGSREELLIERERLRSSGKSLHDQRVKAGDTEAKFMSTLRRFFNDRRHELPSYLNAAYDEVEVERDKLGAMEEDYLQAERTLSGSEWTFMEKESDVYQFELQEIFTDLFNINTPSQSETQFHTQFSPALPNNESDIATFDPEGDYRNAIAEHDDFKKQFDHLRVEQSESFDLYGLPRVRNAEAIAGPASNPELPPQSSELLENLIASEVKVQRLKQQQHLHDNMAPLLDRRMSYPLESTKTLLPPVDNLPRAQTESAVPTLLNDPVTLLKISEWLLDYLRDNRIVNHPDEPQEFASRYRITGSREQAQVSERMVRPSAINFRPNISANDTKIDDSEYHKEDPSSDQSVTVTASVHDEELARQARPTSQDQLLDAIPPNEPLKQFSVDVPIPIFRKVTFSPSEIILSDIEPQYRLDLFHPRSHDLLHKMD
ncbi:hypothetical protein CC80DRAFT_39499 [Byssothecium circinans]|uniref:Uncharacterized protein n=1 Tax=Byssothecium circinans TaxID=147558 RepID=A0A6A5U0B3_9PLEO|nr:hypothetical protein CC80DRAFT_39499 [Byssothecium circinans]